MRIRLSVLCLTAALISPALSQEPSLGDVARASRAKQAQGPKAAKVLSNEDSNPQAIKDGEDPLAVFQRASASFIHDTGHRCLEESSGNSGPGWRKSASYEVAAADRMRLVALEGSSRAEWLLVGDAYYSKQNGESWRKLTDPAEIRMGQITFRRPDPAGIALRLSAGQLEILGRSGHWRSPCRPLPLHQPLE
jgi:hypothetical protein